MNVLWAVVDCLRYDALSINGYSRETSLSIDDRLREDFISFEDAATQSAFTLTVLSSILTGTYPTTNGVIRWNDRLPDELPTYAEIVAGTDLPRATAVSGMNFLTEEWGLKRSFDTVYDLQEEKSNRGCNQARAEEICECAKKVIGERKTFNTLLWFFDLHTPWLSEPQFKGRNPARDSYDTEIRYVTRQLADLFSYLERTGKYDETMIIITADHGDIFQEYHRYPWNPVVGGVSRVPGFRSIFAGDGYRGHLGQPLFDELVHVPLYIKLPNSDYAGANVSGQVELIDVLPTILAEADGEAHSTCEGRSLLPTIRKNDPGKEYVRAILGADPADGLFRMVRSAEYKYLSFEPAKLGDFEWTKRNLLSYVARKALLPSEVLLDRDDESSNVLDSNPDVAEILRNQVGPEEQGVTERDISNGKREELQDLGYL